MTRPNMIPLALLRELAVVVPDPMRPAQFVDLAEMMAGRSQPVASLPSPAAAATAPDVATTPDKKGLPWTIEELMRAADAPVASASAIWTEDEGRRLLAARAKGVPFKVIAEELGRTVRACEQRMTKLTKGSQPPEADVTSPKRNEPASPVAVKAPTPAPVTKAPASFASSPARKEAVKADDAQLRAPLNEKQRRILDGLCRLSDDFESEDDLLLAEGVIGRRALDLIADELGCETKDVKNRWKAMMFEDVVDWRGHPTIGGQSDLLTALRARIQSGDAANG